MNKTLDAEKALEGALEVANEGALEGAYEDALDGAYEGAYFDLMAIKNLVPE